MSKRSVYPGIREHAGSKVQASGERHSTTYAAFKIRIAGPGKRGGLPAYHKKQKVQSQEDREEYRHKS